MKKFLDRYVFRRTGIQILFSVVVIALFSIFANFCRDWFISTSGEGPVQHALWGFKQISSTAMAIRAIESVDTVVADENGGQGAKGVLLFISLGAWLVGMVIYSFVTGSIVNAFRNRKQKIDSGHVRYRFEDHGVVIGWDFQGIATVLALLDKKGLWKCHEIVVLSEQSAQKIRSELSKELDEKELSRVFIYNGSVGVEADLRALWAHKAKVIVILGDRNETNNDGGNMRISILVGEEIEKTLSGEKESGKSGKRKAESEKRKTILVEPIPMFVDITGLHAVRPARHSPKSGYGEDWPNVTVSIVNFFEEAAHELFSSVSTLKGTDQNIKGEKEPDEEKAAEWIPLHFRTNSEATHAHLVVSGFNQMAQAIVLRAARILGAGTAPDRITVFTTDTATVTRFRGAFPVDRLLNVCVEFVQADIADPAQAKRLGAIARDTTASVTLAICENTPDKALETFACLPRSLRFEKIRVLIEQHCQEKWTWSESCLRWMGYEDVTFFGFTDRYLSAVDDREAIFRALSPDADYVEPAITPAFLETLAVCGYHPASTGSEPAHVFSDDAIECLARTSQNGRANGELLDGREPGTNSIHGLLSSDKIHPWGDLSNLNRAELVDQWRKALPIMEGILASGKKPLHIVPVRPSLRIGILPSGKPLWTTKEERKEFVARMEATDTVIRAKANLSSDEHWPSVTVLSADPTDPDSLKFAQWYSATKVRLDAVLPAPVETCAAAIADPFDREEFLQLLRNAWDVTIAPDSDVTACIRNRATFVADLANVSTERDS